MRVCSVVKVIVSQYPNEHGAPELLPGRVTVTSVGVLKYTDVALEGNTT